MSIELHGQSTPVVCDMTGASDTADERMAEWGRLLASAYLGRERTDGGVRFRFRADDGIEAWVRDLAVRDKACCPFLDFTVTTAADEVRWVVAAAAGTTIDDELAGPLLDWFYDLPETAGEGVAGMIERFTDQGMTMSSDPSGTVIKLTR